jgi:homoserine dehydrogenase
MPIIVEVAGGRGVMSTYVRRALESGKHVITANKAMLAAEGPELFALARKHKVAIAFEASVAGGIPVITAMQFGLMANRIDALYGILNGTCNYILTEMTREGKSYATALAEAQAKGYAEVDPTLDVSGKDAAQKLAVLASLAFGVSVHESDVWNEGIDSLDLADIRFAAELGYDIKLLAIAERTANGDSALSLRVHPSFIHASAPLAQVRGSFNALSVYGHAVGHTMSYGRGAGQMPTASAVVSDILNVASGWYPLACQTMHLLSDRQARVQTVAANDLVSRFYIRMTALDVPGVMAKVSDILGQAGISLSAILQHEANVGQFVPLVIVTHKARQGALLDAINQIERLDVIDGKPVCIRIVDMPAE